MLPLLHLLFFSNIASSAGLLNGDVHRLLDGVVVSCWVWFSPIGGCVARTEVRWIPKRYVPLKTLGKKSHG